LGLKPIGDDNNRLFASRAHCARAGRSRTIESVRYSLPSLVGYLSAFRLVMVTVSFQIPKREIVVGGCCARPVRIYVFLSWFCQPKSYVFSQERDGRKTGAVLRWKIEN